MAPNHPMHYRWLSEKVVKGLEFSKENSSPGGEPLTAFNHIQKLRGGGRSNAVISAALTIN